LFDGWTECLHQSLCASVIYRLCACDMIRCHKYQWRHILCMFALLITPISWILISPSFTRFIEPHGLRIKYSQVKLSFVFNVRLLHAVAFSKKLPWFEPTNVITLKTATACSKRMRKTLVATQLYVTSIHDRVVYFIWSYLKCLMKKII